MYALACVYVYIYIYTIPQQFLYCILHAMIYMRHLYPTSYMTNLHHVSCIIFSTLILYYTLCLVSCILDAIACILYSSICTSILCCILDNIFFMLYLYPMSGVLYRNESYSMYPTYVLCIANRVPYIPQLSLL